MSVIFCENCQTRIDTDEDVHMECGYCKKCDNGTGDPETEEPGKPWWCSCREEKIK